MNKWTRRLELSTASAGPAAAANATLAHHYFAFLSYSHADSTEADWLHQELERFRVPSTLAGRLTANGVIPKRLSPIFRDRHELAAGEDLTEEIRVALMASRCLIVLCSPAAAKSKWTNEEIEYFKRVHPDGCVIAAIVAGEPGREGDDCFPAALTQQYDRRGRPTGRRAEPLAADLRDTADGKRLGLLKIIAGILGVGLDDLVQRDHLRRQRRLAAISGGSFLGMLVATGLAVTAIQARDAARDQRREAEGLVEFMVVDLRKKLEPIGRLDALDGVGSRVLQYYGKQDPSELSDRGLEQRSSALNLLAQVAFLRGNLTEAQQLSQEASAGTAEGLRRNPDDPQRLFDHAQNIFWDGEIARNRGQMARAEAAYREYKRLADKMVALEPDNLKWRMEVLYANENLGIVLLSQRRFAEAGGQFETALRAMESLSAVDPGNRDYQKELANALYWIAESQRSEGNFGGAIAARERQLSLIDKLLGGGADVELRRQSMVAHLSLGVLFGEQGRAKAAVDDLQRAIAEADRLISLDPTNAVWKLVAANARLELGKDLLALGRQDDARRETMTGCGLVTGLGASGADSGRVRVIQTDCLVMRARLALASDSTAEASAAAESAVRSAGAERQDPVTDRYRIALASLLLGDIRQRTGDSSSATAAWNAGLAQLPAGVVERPWEMNVRSELLRRLGRGAEARPLTARLEAIGYRSAT
jgi:tetratricopeptide (TPR) repeat protein